MSSFSKMKPLFPQILRGAADVLLFAIGKFCSELFHPVRSVISHPFVFSRGDFQYKKMKVSADEWYENTEDVWLKNETSNR